MIKGKKVLVDESFLPVQYKAHGEDDGFKPISHKKIKRKKKQNNKAVGQKQYVDPGMRKFFEEMGGSSSGDSGNTPILNFRTKNKLFGKDEERRQPSTASVS